MAEVQIDETRLGNLTAIAQLTDAALKNPKTRKAYLQAIKEANPQIPIPEIDAAEPINSEISEMKNAMTKFMDDFKKERDDEKSQNQIKEVKRSYEAGKSKLLDLGYTPEAIGEIEKLMESEGITNWEVGRKAFEYDNPRPAPAAPSRANFFSTKEKSQGDDSDYIKSLFEAGAQGNEQALDTQINKVLDEARQGLSQFRR
jgi:hypothetical protein